MSTSTRQPDVARLEAEFRAYRRRTTFLQLFLLLGAVMAFTRAPEEVLRVRGLIVEDSLGRARVVIGAPLGLPGYEVHQSGSGIAVLSATGRLQVAMGSPTPSPRVDGRVADRVGGDAGVVIADSAGNERGGMGTFADGRANICLDYARGVKEAACLVVFPNDQMAGLVVNGTPSQRGFDRLTALVTENGSALVKVSAPGGQERAVLVARGNGPAQLIVHDSATNSFKNVMPKH